MVAIGEMDLTRPESGEHYRFNYKGMHRYLITLPVYASKKIFTDKVLIRRVLDILRESCWKYHFDLYAYCFMPSQLIMIVRGKEEYSDMKAFLSTFRSVSSTSLEPQLKHVLWKKRYLERVLRKKEDSRKIADGIFQLPVKAGLAASGAEYPFQGSFVVRFTRD
jgi:REP element-mobilizing transposase RayT